jgi:hypothetical protein
MATAGILDSGAHVVYASCRRSPSKWSGGSQRLIWAAIGRVRCALAQFMNVLYDLFVSGALLHLATRHALD